TQKALDAFCNKFYVPEEVHPVLPNQNDTMHERPAGKIRLYTRFFDFANFRLPLSAFLVDVVRHFRINISQLSVIGTTKVDDFACPSSFSWYTSKHVTRDPAPVAIDFNAQDYATLVAHPSPFRKFLEAFMCLVGLSRHYTLDEETYPRFCIRTERAEMDIFTFIHTPDSTKVIIVKREQNEGVARLLDTTIGRTVSLLPVALDQQGDSTGGELDANIQPVVETTNIVVENVATVQSRRQGKMKSVIVDAGGASCPPKKRRKDHGTPSLTSVGASISTTLERESGDHVDSMTKPNLCTIGAPRRSFVSIMTTATTLTSTADPTSVAKEKLVEPSTFSAGSSLASETDPTTGVFSDLTGSDFLNGSRLDDGRVCREMVDEFAPPKFFVSVRGMEHDQLFTEFNVEAVRQMSLSAEVRMRAEYNVKEKRRLKSVVERHDEILKVREEEIKILKARLLLREAEVAKANCLRAEASNFETVEKFLRDETNALRECNIIIEKERNALDVKVTELETSAMSKERELTDLNALVTSFKSQNDNLTDQVRACILRLFLVFFSSIFLHVCFHVTVDESVNDKFDRLYVDFGEMALYLEEKFYHHLLTTIFGRRWLLTHGMKLAIANCLNSPEYLFALEAAIGKAIEKGMQDGLAAGINHGKEGMVLTDLQNVNFSLLARLKSNKDASVETVMDILRLERPLDEKLGLNELQHHVDQLMVPIHSAPDKVVVGATALSLALDVSSVRVQKIMENIVNQIRDVFVHLAEPLSATVLTGTEGTPDTAAATADITTTLSKTFASASTIAPISVDDYEVMGEDDQAVADEDAASFPNVDDAELNIP
nr:transposase (putative), gypsy type [Tanacetum cinerariifolium]